MRFFADGPDIPEALLEACDRGGVVFFCGAGISRSAGLPGFFELTKKVIEALGVPKEKAENLGATTPLDRVFGLLQREYGTAEIENRVAQELKTEAGAFVQHHETILQLSRNANRNAETQ